jgi:predicted Zn-dependent protease
MQWLVMTILGLLIATAARAEDIVDVLRRSQQQRLAAMTPAPDGERVQVVRRSFEAVRRKLQGSYTIPAVDLHVISGPVLAETLHGHVVVANVSLADLPEGERTFVLAHELGHVVHRHWLQMGLLYRRWIPGEVTPERTDPVAGALGREASALAHRQEFEADAFALDALGRLGHSSHVAFSAFHLLGMQQDTPTHPGTRKRLAWLRSHGSQ